MKKQPISAVIITFNCGEILKKTLQSVSWCDEILIVDSGSTDQTLEICQQHNCTIHHRTFDGYGTQKQYAVNWAKNHWILSIDGDEVITKELKAEIENRLSTETVHYKGFYIPITLVFFNRVFNYGNENKKLHLRLFNRNFGNFNEVTVHESIIITGETCKLRNEILHYSYLNVHHYFEKFNKYTTFFVNDASKKCKKANLLKITIRLPFDFIKYYFLNRNFLNGYAGFVWSVFSSWYSFVKYIKLFEYQKK